MGDWTTVDEMNEPERAHIELNSLDEAVVYHGVQ
jgi:hypothetical protein